jgi:hypothetical protein
MRNAGQPDLVRLCLQTRQQVETQDFQPIQLIPGVIDLLSPEEMQDMIRAKFEKQTKDSRILAYTNQRVIDYNTHIRDIRGLNEEYGVGEILVSNSTFMLTRTIESMDGDRSKTYTQSLSVETEVEILSQDEKITYLLIETTPNGEKIKLAVRLTTFKTGLGQVFTDVPLSVNRSNHAALSKHYARIKNWKQFFYLKDGFPDLRPRDAATVHKAQGSSYDTVFVDLANLSECRNPLTAARLLNVAVSRAQNRVFFYGELSAKYGGIIQ